MGSRQSKLTAAILLTAALVFGCQSNTPESNTSPDRVPGTSAEAEESAPPIAAQEPPATLGTEPEAAPVEAESHGLVGTNVDAEAIAINDEGPVAPVILFTAGLKGYTEPCGCTLDLVLGGLDRVTGYLRGFTALNEHTLVVDAGNLLFERDELRESERAQEIRKTSVLIEALTRAGTFATTPGPTDFAAGLEFYQETLGATSVRVLSANLRTESGDALGEAFATTQLGTATIGIIGAADPSGFESIPILEATAALEPISTAAANARAQDAEAVILLWQGDLASARTQLRDITDVDFIVIGQPRDTDEIERVGSAFTLESYDQGRRVGRLKLAFGDAAEWNNARAGSDEEIARLERVIAGIEEQLAAAPETEEPPPIVLRQRQRITGLQDELDSMRAATVDFSRPRTFLFRPIAMEPGLPTDPPVTDAMRSYNAALQAINSANAEPALPSEDGMPHYVGVEECGLCHREAVEFWETTSHAHAWSTLVERDKNWDRSCVGCHATGYGAPGGSALGHTDGLVNVQCEQCHGPGSMHADRPRLRSLPLGVVRETTAETCVGCHNEEHSTTFDYATYLPRIIGPGHGE